MSDELAWIKGEITKMLVDLATNGRPSAENLARSLGRLLTEYKEPKPLHDRLHNGG